MLDPPSEFHAQAARRPGRSSFLAACVLACCAGPSGPPPPATASPAILASEDVEDDDSFETAIRTRLRECATERERGDPVRARVLTEELIAEVEASPHPDAALILDARAELARALVVLGDAPRAIELLEGVLAARTRALPAGALLIEATRVDLADACRAARDFARARDVSGEAMEALQRSVAEDQRDLLKARLVHAVALSSLGEAESARPLAEATLAHILRTSGEEDPDLQLARVHVALVLSRLGQLDEAHALNVAAEASLAKLLPAGHPSLLRVRISLASTTRDLGDYARALALLLLVAEQGTRALSEEHSYVLAAQADAAYLLTEMGRAREALALEERLLAVQERLKGCDHPDALAVKGAMGLTLRVLGRSKQARSLQEEVVAGLTARLPEDDPQVIRARGNLAITVLEFGDPWSARAEFVRIGAIYAKSLPEDHPEFLLLRQNLAVALVECGDFEAARALEERTIETLARTLPDDHPTLQVARVSLAATLYQVGHDEEAHDLLEKVLAILSPMMEADHVYLVAVRQNLSTVLKRLGDLERALELDQQNLEVLSRSADPDSILLQHAKLDLSSSMRGIGEVAESCALAESALVVLRQTLPPGHVSTRRALLGLSISRRVAGDLEGTCGAARELCAALRHQTTEILLRSSPREAEEATEPDREAISWVLEIALAARAQACGDELGREAFELVEGRRSLGLRAARLQRLLSASPAAGEMRSREREASQRIARLVRDGGSREELDEARRALDRAQQDLAAEAGRAPGAAAYLAEVRAEDLRLALRPAEALVGFWRYTRLGEVRVGENDVGAEERILAHVLAADGSLARIDVGSVAELGALVEAFRASIGEDAGRGVPVDDPVDGTDAGAARELGRRLFEPLRAPLGDATKITVALDDLLTLVPLEALPDPQNETGLIGERIGVRVVSALAELAWPVPEPPTSTRLLALGGLDYDHGGGAAMNGAAGARAPDPAPTRTGLSRRPGPSTGFAALPATGTEIESIAELLRSSNRGEAVLLRGAEGSPSDLAALAPGARWLHLATHGWFAPGSADSGGDATPLDPKSGFGRRRSAMEQVRGSMPMALCGLALTGANHRDGDAGVITAEEIATLDLRRCELAVLSACDTSVGVLRAGQGVASLRKALQMAGARTVVTSLWKVPDEATEDLMVDFYRRIWVDGQPKDQALWEAKMRLRDARDESGNPRYSRRDWAAWVLTGDPD